MKTEEESEGEEKTVIGTHTRCYSTMDGWMAAVAAAGDGLYNLIWI